MKRFVLLFALFTLGFGANAQNTDNGWLQQQDKDNVFITADGRTITIDRNTYTWRPFSDAVGLSLYGSRYRKAKSSKNWGMFLTTLVAPASGAFIIYSLDHKVQGGALVGGAALAGSLGAGIPLWIKGRRELDAMIDDYAQRFSPKPYSSSVTVGPTANGVGLALSF